jgi:hypothetical protein
MLSKDIATHVWSWEVSGRKDILIILSLYYGQIWTNIGKATLGRNFDITSTRVACVPCSTTWDSGYQLSICYRIEENHGKPWSTWPVAGPSGCKLTSSQQSGINYANPNVSPYLCSYFIWNQAVSRRLPTAETRVQIRVWSCTILWWTKVALGQVFLENFGFPCQSTSHLLLHNHLHYHPRLAQ